jgi:hypothetical protein
LKQNGSRNYEVFGTRAKAAKIKSARYLDTRFMPLGGLSVRVSPSEADTSNPPKRLTVSAEIAGEYFLKTESFKVEHRDGYLDFDRALEAAISQLKEGALCSTVEQRLVEKVRNLNGIDYKPVVGFVSELFKSEDEIIQRLGKVRERLFDSSVVVEKVLKPLMEKLNDRISNEMQKKLPMSARLELSRWKIPIELIEQQEEYVWLKRQNFQEPFSDTAEYEYGAFRQQLSGLLPTYLNKFIAMCGGKVIDEDSDEFVLLERLGRRAENKFVLIQKVTDEDPQEVWLDPEEVGT